MSQTCEYCDGEHDVTDTVYARISHGFGHTNKEALKFCSVECRVWWRRRESDRPGAWEQPAPVGYQSRLDRFRTDDANQNDGSGRIDIVSWGEHGGIGLVGYGGLRRLDQNGQEAQA